MNERADVANVKDDERHSEEPGTFVWDLKSNVVNGDATVAELFDLDIVEVLAGLPIEDFIARVHPDDKPKMAKSLHRAIVTGDPYREDYRLFARDMRVLRVIACGRCFRNQDGIPSHLSGIVFPAARPQQKDVLLNHIVLAYEAAKLEGSSEIAGALEILLGELPRHRTKRTVSSTH